MLKLTIKSALFLTLVSNAVLALLIGVLVAMLNDAQQDVQQRQVSRYRSYLLADELRQSSDDLTRFARTYVVTGDAKYEQMYNDVLAIRNGQKPRPAAYERIYWDFYAATGDKPRPDEAAVALQELMKRAGFTEAEFAKLHQAQANSDGLVKTEMIAMNAVKGLFDDGAGKFSVRKQPDLELARRLMHAPEYHKAKADIMRPIDEFFVLLDGRTAAAVEQAQAAVRTRFRLISVLLLLLVAVVVGVRWARRASMNAISQAVSTLSSSSTEIAATVEQHERTVMQQSAAATEVTTTAEELGASALQSANQAESASAAAREALGLTQEGVALASRASASVAGMKQKIDSVAEQILRLSEQAGQIGGIARVVGELAGETNMLALNAAVEAARAGEQGKGFAVVAAEVRKLADQSKKSAERANVLVAEIQKATNSAVMVTEEGSRSAEEVTVIAQSVAQAFASIALAADRVSENAQQVTLNSKQQSTALGQVTEAMRSLAEGSRQMAAGTEQTKVGVQKLNQVALGLKAMV